MGILRELSDQQQSTLDLVGEALSVVQSILERNDQDIKRVYQASVVHEEPIGRPRFDISRHQLACLLQGHLLAFGIRVQQQRVRESQKSTYYIPM